MVKFPEFLEISRNLPNSRAAKQCQSGQMLHLRSTIEDAEAAGRATFRACGPSSNPQKETRANHTLSRQSAASVSSSISGSASWLLSRRFVCCQNTASATQRPKSSPGQSNPAPGRFRGSRWLLESSLMSLQPGAWLPFL